MNSDMMSALGGDADLFRLTGATVFLAGSALYSPQGQIGRPINEAGLTPGRSPGVVGIGGV
jgi:hypothetical protein